MKMFKLVSVLTRENINRIWFIGMLTGMGYMVFLAPGPETDEEFLNMSLKIVVTRKRTGDKAYYLEGRDMDNKETVTYDPLHGAFERRGLLPLFEATIIGDTLYKRAGDSAVWLHGHGGPRKFTAHLILRSD
jgi:hypothetical protein